MPENALFRLSCAKVLRFFAFAFACAFACAGVAKPCYKTLMRLCAFGLSHVFLRRSKSKLESLFLSQTNAKTASKKAISVPEFF